MAEPRLGVTQNGPLRILEARDDRSNSLLAEGQRNLLLSRSATYLAGTCSSVLQLHAPLSRPDNPGQSIKILRGVVPLRVTARRPDPLVVPLAGATGKAFDQGDLHLTIHEVRSDPNSRQQQIELSVRAGRSDGSPPTDETPVQDLNVRSDPHQQNIEIVDARDHVRSWFQTSLDIESSRITLTLAASPAAAELKELRYYRLTETVVDVPFSFADVPMP
jgi:hypothetical protein